MKGKSGKVKGKKYSKSSQDSVIANNSLSLVDKHVMDNFINELYNINVEFYLERHLKLNQGILRALDRANFDNLVHKLVKDTSIRFSKSQQISTAKILKSILKVSGMEIFLKVNAEGQTPVDIIKKNIEKKKIDTITSPLLDFFSDISPELSIFAKNFDKLAEVSDDNNHSEAGAGSGSGSSSGAGSGSGLAVASEALLTASHDSAAALGGLAPAYSLSGSKGGRSQAVVPVNGKLTDYSESGKKGGVPNINKKMTRASADSADEESEAISEIDESIMVDKKSKTSETSPSLRGSVLPTNFQMPKTYDPFKINQEEYDHVGGSYLDKRESDIMVSDSDNKEGNISLRPKATIMTAAMRVKKLSQKEMEEDAADVALQIAHSSAAAWAPVITKSLSKPSTVYSEETLSPKSATSKNSSPAVTEKTRSVSYEEKSDLEDISLSERSRSSSDPQMESMSLKNEEKDEKISMICDNYAKAIQEKLFDDKGKTFERKREYKEKLSDTLKIAFLRHYVTLNYEMKDKFLTMLEEKSDHIIGDVDCGLTGYYNYTGLIAHVYESSRMSSILSFGLVGRISFDIDDINKKTSFVTKVEEFIKGEFGEYSLSQSSKCASDSGEGDSSSLAAAADEKGRKSLDDKKLEERLEESHKSEYKEGEESGSSEASSEVKDESSLGIWVFSWLFGKGSSNSSDTGADSSEHHDLTSKSEVLSSDETAASSDEVPFATLAGESVPHDSVTHGDE